MPVHFGIVVFPGSNCDHDAYHAATHVLGEEATFIWHEDESVGDVDVPDKRRFFPEHVRSGVIGVVEIGRAHV